MHYHTQALTALCSTVLLLSTITCIYSLYSPCFQLIFTYALRHSSKEFSALCNYTKAST